MKNFTLLCALILTTTLMWTDSYGQDPDCEPGSIPFFDGFENGYTANTDVDGCWSQENVTGNGKWIARNTGGYNQVPRTGDWYLSLGSSEVWAFYPLELAGGTEYQLSFYARRHAYEKSVMASFGTGASDAEMTTEIIPRSTVPDQVYQEYVGNFTPTDDGVYYIGIKGYGGYQPLTIDDISVTFAPTCLKPSNLAVDATTESTANISWTEGDSETNWEVKYSDDLDFDPETQGSSKLVSGSPNTILENLDPETTYKIYAKAICSGGDGESIYGEPVEFTTPCVSVGDFVENFDSTANGQIPDCWNSLISRESSSSTYLYVSTNTNAVSQPKDLRFVNTWNGTVEFYLTSPPFE